MNSNVLQMEQLMSILLPRGRRWDHLELLERIDQTGSIAAAARAMDLSYKAAWEAVLTINNLSSALVVERQAGGQHGGGASLTQYGRRLVRVYRQLEKGEALVLTHFDKLAENFEHYFKLIRRFDMQTSCRNQFLGTVSRITGGPVNAEVVLDLGRGDELVAVITHSSVEHLGLEPGKQAYALIKAPWVIVAKNDGRIKTSARNQLNGLIVSMHEGSVNTEVVIELPGGKTVTAMITNESVTDMALALGEKACALIKASHIILAVAN